METVDYLFRHLAISSILTCVRRLQRTPWSRSLLIVSCSLVYIYCLLSGHLLLPRYYSLMSFSPKPYFVMKSTRHSNCCQSQTFLTAIPCLPFVLEMTDTDVIGSAATQVEHAWSHRKGYGLWFASSNLLLFHKLTHRFSV